MAIILERQFARLKQSNLDTEKIIWPAEPRGREYTGPVHPTPLWSRRRSWAEIAQVIFRADRAERNRPQRGGLLERP